jgi:hypothetical protein
LSYAKTSFRKIDHGTHSGGSKDGTEENEFNGGNRNELSKDSGETPKKNNEVKFEVVGRRSH